MIFSTAYRFCPVLRGSYLHNSILYFAEIFTEIWEDVRSDVEEIYPKIDFPQICVFPEDLEVLLTEKFWNS
ncbi:MULTISPECIES: hypothetical protein [unclassified Roseofilum]|uniref:hypothetical protein n=1 Tax=unclassified Roseofilum TaxID=2620099 RepID=UPI000E8FC14A|nr:MULTISPECIES: hypothetical protein [unclassified Roseofilum]MBP0010524.1 hypothetical protein [Roseofilum sp. Belize Diploria]MBP0034929.1 hypothetical protein [Roseofilum sp. Belize BBD 4]HBQ99011.1 hypothetical protein [Cyanobacteria bacterium UBA11691]